MATSRTRLVVRGEHVTTGELCILEEVDSIKEGVTAVQEWRRAGIAYPYENDIHLTQEKIVTSYARLQIP